MANIPDCSLVYSETQLDEKAGFENGIPELSREIITPELNRLYRTYKIPITQLKMSILISYEGKAIAFRYDSFMPEIYQNQLSNLLRAKEGWIPGRVNGSPVCGELKIRIDCIKYS